MEEEKTYKDDLDVQFDQITLPLKALYELLDEYLYEGDPEIQKVCLIFKPLFDRLQGDLKKIDEVIYRSLGKIEFEIPKPGKCVTVEGKQFYDGAYIKAILTPKENAA